MQLLDHVSISVADLSRVRSFYLATMATIGARLIYDEPTAMGFGERNDAEDDTHTYLSIIQSTTSIADEKRHWCFRAQSKEQVRQFYNAGLDAGGRCCGAPGQREYHRGYYAAFLFDPDGNKVEIVSHLPTA